MLYGNRKEDTDYRIKGAHDSHQTCHGNKKRESARIGETSGIPYGTLRKILELNTVADYEQMAKIADALHMPLSKIIEDAEKLATDPDIIAEFNEEYGTDIPLPGPTEQEIIDSMLRQLKEDPYSLAALRDPNKEIEMRGDAGPDWDDPA